MSKNFVDKKAMHVSFDKEYQAEMTDILNYWEKKQKNFSQKACESLIMMNQIEKSPNINRYLSTYKLIYGVLIPYCVEKTKKELLDLTDEIFSDIVQIDSKKLKKFLDAPINYLNKNN